MAVKGAGQDMRTAAALGELYVGFIYFSIYV